MSSLIIFKIAHLDGTSLRTFAHTDPSFVVAALLNKKGGKNRDMIRNMDLPLHKSDKKTKWLDFKF